MKIADYLGKDVSRMLSTSPFQQWHVERSFEDELDEPIIHYVFPKNGLELRCDVDDTISVIFVFSEEFGNLDQKLFDVGSGWSRRQVLAKFGEPSKSGRASKHPVLGEYGAWDRFASEGYAVRYEYDTEAESIRKITFMREDVVP